MTDERGLSVALNYILSLVIVTMVISGLFVGMNNVVTTERENAARAEFDVLGNRLAADLAVADRLAQTASGPTAAVAVRTDVPAQIAGVDYQIVLGTTGGPDYYDVTVTLVANSLSVERSTTVRLAHPVDPGTVSGGEYVITFDGTSLEVSNG